MVDVKAVGADLTPAQRDEVMEDLSFFLDEFGSTSAVRLELQKQEADIKRLERQVNYLLNPQQNASSHQGKGELDNTSHHTKQTGHVVEGVDETMANLEFFLRTFGSTRAVRDKLRIQKLKMVGLSRTVEWCKRKQRSDNKELAPALPPAVAKGKGALTQVGQGAACELSAPPPAASPTNLGQEKTIELGVSGRASGKRKRNLCQEPGCTKVGKTNGAKKGYCFGHGGGQTCSQPGCTKARLKRGLCGAHGGYYECKVAGCTKRIYNRGYCYAHYREYDTATINGQNSSSVIRL